MTTPPPFADAARDFDPGPFAVGAAAAQQQREAIVKQFPRTDWPTLPVERYAVGQSDVDTFCRQVEFRSDDLGSISGGSALKLLISRNAKTGTWRFPERYSSLDQAWTEVRAGFVMAFELADRGNWEAISNIESLRGFVEGFRPIGTGTTGLTLSLQDGVFKRICRAALARPGQRFLVLIDEINRANIAKEVIVYNRLNQHYEAGHDLAWLVLQGLSVRSIAVNNEKLGQVAEIRICSLPVAALLRERGVDGPVTRAVSAQLLRAFA